MSTEPESRFAHLNPTKDEEGSLIVAEYEGWKTGERVRVLDDADESGPYAGTYAGDEGELQIEIVGSPQYGNERVSFGIKTEHFDEFTDVDPHNIEAARPWSELREWLDEENFMASVVAHHEGISSRGPDAYPPSPADIEDARQLVERFLDIAAEQKPPASPPVSEVEAGAAGPEESYIAESREELEKERAQLVSRLHRGDPRDRDRLREIDHTVTLLDQARSGCDVPPEDWRCTRESGHDGPCAAVPATPSAPPVEAGGKRFRKRLHGRQPEVEAMLVTDRNGAEVEAWCGALSYDVGMAPGQTHHLDITRPDGSKTRAYVDDYIVRDGDKLYPQSKRGFEFNYEPIATPPVVPAPTDPPVSGEVSYKQAFEAVCAVIHAANPGQTVQVDRLHKDRDGGYFTITVGPYASQVQIDALEGPDGEPVVRIGPGWPAPTDLREEGR